MNPDVVSVLPQENFTLALKFANGEEGVFDCAHLLDFGVFQELKDIRYFKRVRIENGTVSWPHGQDLCPDTLYLSAERSSGGRLKH